MPRLISTEITQDLYANINVIHSDGTIDTKKIRIGDTIENLRYVEDNEIKVVSGKIKEFETLIRRYPRVSNVSPSYQENTFKDDVELTSITIDASEEYESKIVNVKASEVVEDSGVSDVIRVDLILDLNADLKLTYDDNSTVTIKLIPGEILSNVVIANANTAKPNTTGTYTLSKFMYKKNADSPTGLSITSLVLIDGDSVFNIPIDRIVGVDGILEVTSDVSIFESSINDASSLGIAVENIEYNNPITLGKKFTIAGANYGVPANNGTRATNDTLSNETVLSGAITFNTDADIVLDGLTFTSKAKIEITDSKKVSIKNCRFINMNPATKEMLIQGYPGNGNSVLVEIENCYFGDVNTEATGNIYNLFEITCKLADGSYIKNNRFSEAVCTHNLINIYDVEEGGRVTVENNLFEYSANAIRIGIKGEPTCKIDILSNTYMKTDSENPDYAGLLLIQPYGKETTSFKNCTINLSRNINRSGVAQIYYKYAGGNDMQFTEYNVPTIIFNGKTVLSPKEES